MNKDMTYCVNKDCPFKSCERHIHQIKGKTGVYSFANFDSVCRKYISWLVNKNKEV